jgi:hypothetical protein
MANIILIHGAYGNPDENWFPYIKTELEKIGHKVLIPKFPTPENQSLESWLEVFKDYEQYLNENSIIIGHSIGPAFTLHILEKLSAKIKAAFFVAGFVGMINNPKFDEINKTITENNFDFEKIKSNCKRFHIINSFNDPHIPIQKGIYLSRKLETELIRIEGAGHFNEKDGFKEFKYLLEEIKKEL